MNRDTAVDALNQWDELNVGDRPSVGACQRLQSAVAWHVPEPDAYAAALLANGDRAVLVLVDDALYIGTATGESADIRVKVCREPFEVGTITVSMEEWREESPSRSDLIHVWTFERDGKEVVAIKTLQSSGTYDEGTPLAEDFATTLARKVGWEVPVTEPYRP